MELATTVHVDPKPTMTVRGFVIEGSVNTASQKSTAMERPSVLGFSPSRSVQPAVPDSEASRLTTPPRPKGTSPSTPAHDSVPAQTGNKTGALGIVLENSTESTTPSGPNITPPTTPEMSDLKVSKQVAAPTAIPQPTKESLSKLSLPEYLVFKKAYKIIQEVISENSAQVSKCVLKIATFHTLDVNNLDCNYIKLFGIRAYIERMFDVWIGSDEYHSLVNILENSSYNINLQHLRDLIYNALSYVLIQNIYGNPEFQSEPGSGSELEFGFGSEQSESGSEPEQSGSKHGPQTELDSAGSDSDVLVFELSQ